MKKLIGIILIICIGFLLLGCTQPDDSSGDNNIPDQNNSIETQEDAEDALEDISIDISGIENSIDDIEGIIAE